MGGRLLDYIESRAMEERQENEIKIKIRLIMMLLNRSVGAKPAPVLI